MDTVVAIKNRDGISIGRVNLRTKVYMSKLYANGKRYFQDYRNPKKTGIVMSIGELEGSIEHGATEVWLLLPSGNKAYVAPIEKCLKHRELRSGRCDEFWVVPSKVFELREV